MLDDGFFLLQLFLISAVQREEDGKVQWQDKITSLEKRESEITTRRTEPYPLLWQSPVLSLFLSHPPSGFTEEGSHP